MRDAYKDDVEMRPHYLIYGHGGSYNHGCEALTRCTIAYLRGLSPDCAITLSTHFADQDREFGIPADELVERDLSGKENREIYAPTLARITPASVCVHACGDNYCYRNWQRWAAIHYKALERGAKSVLWSCSIDPDVIDAEMLAVFRTHHLVAAREKVTHDLLLDCGLANVVKISDPAFTLKPAPTAFAMRNFVVINVSPLVARKNAAAVPAFQALLEHILRETDMNVALVPHVVQPVDNDYDVLTRLAGRNAYDSDRVALVSDKLSAAQYKHIIGSARFCVAARTHAAIAAYSSLVPTLAVAYSVKARGIAMDLGMAEHILDVERISGHLDLVAAFEALLADETLIRRKLAAQMPSYIQGATREIMP